MESAASSSPVDLLDLRNAGAAGELEEFALLLPQIAVAQAVFTKEPEFSDPAPPCGDLIDLWSEDASATTEEVIIPQAFFALGRGIGYSSASLGSHGFVVQGFVRLV